jgi:hypothetical protein
MRVEADSGNPVGDERAHWRVVIALPGKRRLANRTWPA